MMLALIIQIAGSAIGVLAAYTGGSTGFNIASELVKIAKAANDAHILHTGEPIDPALIAPIEKIP